MFYTVAVYLVRINGKKIREVFSSDGKFVPVLTVSIDIDIAKDKGIDDCQWGIISQKILSSEEWKMKFSSARNSLDLIGLDLDLPASNIAALFKDKSCDAGYCLVEDEESFGKRLRKFIFF